MIHSHEIDGLRVRTGDILCTTDGAEATLGGRLWHLVGTLLPGDCDHVLLYLGPGPLFVEAGPFGVQTFAMGAHFDSKPLHAKRGFLDQLLGMVDLLERDLDREQVRDYCLKQLGKPYNFNFAAVGSEDAFYCSQLVYLAYGQVGINLRTGAGVPPLLPLQLAILPEEIWAGYPDRRRVVNRS